MLSSAEEIGVQPSLSAQFTSAPACTWPKARRGGCIDRRYRKTKHMVRIQHVAVMGRRMCTTQWNDELHMYSRSIFFIGVLALKAKKTAFIEKANLKPPWTQTWGEFSVKTCLISQRPGTRICQLARGLTLPSAEQFPAVLKSGVRRSGFESFTGGGQQCYLQERALLLLLHQHDFRTLARSL